MRHVRPTYFIRLESTWDIFAAHPELHDCAEVYLNIEEYVPDLYLNYRNIPDFELTAAEIITKVCREHGIATVNMNQVLITRRFIETLKDSGIALSPGQSTRRSSSTGSSNRASAISRRADLHFALRLRDNKTPSQREHSRAMAFLEIGRLPVGQRTGAVPQTGSRGR